MPTTYSQQNRPITGGGDGETADGQGLSTRAYRDHRRNANVLKGRACDRNVVPVQWWNPIFTFTGSAAETVAPSGIQWWVPAYNGFATYQWKVWGRMQAGASCIVRVYSDVAHYTTALTAAAVSGSATFTLGTYAWIEGETTIVRPTDERHSFLIMSLDLDAAGSTVAIGAFGAWHKPLADIA